MPGRGMVQGTYKGPDGWSSGSWGSPSRYSECYKTKADHVTGKNGQHFSSDVPGGCLKRWGGQTKDSKELAGAVMGRVFQAEATAKGLGGERGDSGG